MCIILLVTCIGLIAVCITLTLLMRTYHQRIIKQNIELHMLRIIAMRDENREKKICVSGKL
jgi:hypothetical protein